MDWISGIGRNSEGDLGVRVQDTDGLEALKELKALRPDLGVKGVISKKVHIALHDLKPGSTRQYLDDLGFHGLGADGQPVYEVLTEAGTLVIPAQLLVLALFGSHCHVRPALLRPWAPEFLMTAWVDPSTGRLAVHPTPRRMFLLQFERDGITLSLEYALTYPSASAAWGSIYRNALDGRFDMAMPRAVAIGVIRARKVSGKLLVTRLQLMTLTPAEDAHPFAAGVAKSSYILSAISQLRTNHGKARAPLSEGRISPGSGRVTPLTDEQWVQMKPLLLGICKKVRKSKHPLREVFEVIRLKLGTPCTWAKATDDHSLMQCAVHTLLKLKKRGDWEQIVVAAGGFERDAPGGTR